MATESDSIVTYAWPSGTTCLQRSCCELDFESSQPTIAKDVRTTNGTTTNHHALQSAICKFSHQNYGEPGSLKKSNKFIQKAALKISRRKDLLTRRKRKAQEHGQPAFRTGLSYQRVESANQIQRAFIYSCGGCGRSGLYLQWRFLAVGVMMLVVGLLGCCLGCFTKSRGPFHILAVAVDTVVCICNGGFGGGGNDACRWVVGLLF